ncbi:roadblock/LC7 domain-containing protein [Dyella sp.]|uniref:roadblock/LC7 domain-containing protein n=1 Tax=Dyella sp. TaxID=1869338 RepID=UPI002ED19F46
MQANTMAMVVDSMGKAHGDPSLPDEAAVKLEFDRTLGTTPGITVFLLSTSDGRALASYSAALAVDPRRLAAMSNSFLTLGETMAKELGMACADHATVRTNDGNVVLVRIEGQRPLTLAAVARPDTTLATLLFATRECANRIRALIPAVPQ